MKKALLILLTFSYLAHAQDEEKFRESKMEWFNEAKLGIFIHWGIYSVNGISESWSFFNKTISHEDYLKQLKGFTAENYDANEWTSIFKKAGAKYVVLTSKHHDGVALWPTKLSKLSIQKKSPYKKDIIEQYAQALRKEDLKVGLYYSHLDWSEPTYPTVLNSKIREEWQKAEKKWELNKFAYPVDGKEKPEEWEKFIKFHRGQLRELSENYNPDLFWFDGDWERDDEQWKMGEVRKQLLSYNPNTILNGRMKEFGDYKTPEQAMPIVRPEGSWEFCMTINNSWGYRPSDQNYKSAFQIIKIFTECLGMGGNLLLDVGPKPDGTIPEKQVEVLNELGSWIDRHKEAVYPTIGGLPFGHFYGPTSMSKDKKTLYLYLFDQPKETVRLKGVRNGIKKVTVLSNGSEIPYKKVGGATWLNIPGEIHFTIDKNQLDKYVTVIKVELDSELDLYHGAGGAIEAN